MRLLTIMIVLFFICSSTVIADDKKEAEDLIKKTIDEVIFVLKKNDISDEKKKETVKSIVSPLFDFSLMAKLSLGKEAWFNLKEEEQKQFTDLFVKRIKDSYLEKMIQYGDEQILFDTPVQNGRKIQVPTVLVSNGNRYDMLYKMYRSKQGHKIYDVEVQGVSLVKSYRSQFEAILKDGTINEIMAKLSEIVVN